MQRTSEVLYYPPASFATVTPFAAFFGAALLERGHLRVILERRTHFLAQFAGAFAVDDPHERQPGHIGLFQVAIQHIQRIFGALAAQVQFHAGGGSED